MGRTNPTFRRILGTIEDSWQDYRRALRYREQEYFDQLFAYAQEHADASGYLNRDTPMISVLFSMLLGQERRRQELAARVDELEERLEALDASAPDESRDTDRTRQSRR